MLLKETIRINRQIMGLIEGKHVGHLWDHARSIEARYYRQLKLDTALAERQIKDAQPLSKPTREAPCQ